MPRFLVISIAQNLDTVSFLSVRLFFHLSIFQELSIQFLRLPIICTTCRTISSTSKTHLNSFGRPFHCITPIYTIEHNRSNFD